MNDDYIGSQNGDHKHPDNPASNNGKRTFRGTRSTIRTIHKDIQFLSPKFPIYTKQGGNGGIFIEENYKPYINSLSYFELKNLREMYELAEGIHKEVLSGILHKYGPDKLEI